MQSGLLIATAARPAWIGATADVTRSWIAAERGRFALWLPLFMAGGVVGYFSLTFEPPWWIGVFLVAATLLLGWLAGPLRVPCWIAVAAALGLASAQMATLRAPDLVETPRRATIVTGTVRAVEQLPQGPRVTLEEVRFDGAPPVPREVRLRLRDGDEVAVATGDTLRVRAMVMAPSPPAYPGAWDLQRDAFFSGLGGYGYALNPAERVAEANPSGPRALAAMAARNHCGPHRGDAAGHRGRDRRDAADRRHRVDPGSGSCRVPQLRAGAFAGDRRAAYRHRHGADLRHWSWLALALHERPALYWRTKEISALTALAAGGAYMLLTGAHVPIIRSFAMACLVTLGVMVGRRALSLRGLALAMAAVVLLAPNEAVGVSFQMSFSAVLALIVGYARRCARGWRGCTATGRGGGDCSGHVAALALTSALAGTFSASYAAYHFGHIQIYYVIANVGGGAAGRRCG